MHHALAGRLRNATEKQCKMHFKFGVLRVTNAKLWFLTRAGEFLPLCSDTYSTDEREHAYQKARQVHGLMVELPRSGYVPKLATDRQTSDQSEQSQSTRSGASHAQSEPGSAGEVCDEIERVAGRPQRAQERHQYRRELISDLRAQVEACKPLAALPADS